MLNLIHGMLKKGTMAFYKERKGIKKCIATYLCAAIIVTSIPFTNVFANEKNVNSEKDIYAQGFTENVDIEGVTYTYKYYYDENGEKAISVTDNTTSKTEIITYDDKTSNIYVNDEKVGEVKTTDDDGQILDTPQSRTTWNLIGTYHKYITWAQGLSAGTLAGIMVSTIAFVMGPNLTVSIFIASCGIQVFSNIASAASGGTLHWTAWYYTSLLYFHYKYDWSFVAATGDRYGTYHCYFNVE